MQLRGRGRNAADMPSAMQPKQAQCSYEDMGAMQPTRRAQCSPDGRNADNMPSAMRPKWAQCSYEDIGATQPTRRAQCSPDGRNAANTPSAMRPKWAQCSYEYMGAAQPKRRAQCGLDGCNVATRPRRHAERRAAQVGAMQLRNTGAMQPTRRAQCSPGGLNAATKRGLMLDEGRRKQAQHTCRRRRERSGHRRRPGLGSDEHEVAPFGPTGRKKVDQKVGI